MNKIFTKIFLGYLITIVVLSILILSFSFSTIREYYLISIKSELGILTNTIKLQSLPYLENTDNKHLDSLIKVIGNENHVRITIIDPKGKVLADSKADPASMDNHITRPEIIDAKFKSSGESIRKSITTNDEMIYVAKTIVKNNNIIGYARLSFFLKDINILIEVLTDKIRNITFLFVLISLIAAYFVTKNITKPLKKLTEASKKVAEGDFNIKVETKSNDESGKLADAFNNMTTHINYLFKQISNQNEELERIIDSLQLGFVVFDINGKILLTNAAFKSIINSNEINGKNIIEVIHIHTFQKYVANLQKIREYQTIELQLANNTYFCTGNYLKSKSEIIIALYDITEMKRIELIKKDFVVNVSHELRTPLTAIKGFIETLEDDETEKDKLHYLEIIHNHTNRLINIVNDLLSLSNLENFNTKLDTSEFDLNNFLLRIFQIFEQKLKSKNLTLELESPSDLPKITADEFKLEQVFINLIDNSIKYTDNGGIKIKIESKQKSFNIEFVDTGIGIPKESIERIFERFYTVDKSRTRKMGGTGLGLSIVKHIIMLHDGNIKVESTPGIGTTFLINLPMR